MYLTDNLLQRLERNTQFKQGYLTAGSLGQNKLVALPVVLAIAGLYGAYECYDLSKSDASYKTYMQICLALVVICVIAIIIIQRNARKAVAENLDDVPVCVAKKVYGNDKNGIYYCIYTPGAKRHDSDYIEDVAYRIFNIHEEPDNVLRSQINKLFDIQLADTNRHAVRLPDAIAPGEEIYQRQFSLNALGTDMANLIDENEGRFGVLAFNKTNAIMIKPGDIKAYAS